MMPEPRPDWWPATLEVADATVNIEHLDHKMIEFLVTAAVRHFEAYGKALVVTSGNDGKHAAGSKHFSWKAVDLRSRDTSIAEQQDFAHFMSDVQQRYEVGIFDERFIGPPHWHVEVA